MDNIRLATIDEVESIRLKADLAPASTVVAFERKDGPSDLAVIRQVTELDPLICAEQTDGRRKALFVWALENAMRVMGLPAYYFNVAASDASWNKIVQEWGAERTSPSEEFRYVKLLQPKVAANGN